MAVGYQLILVSLVGVAWLVEEVWITSTKQWPFQAVAASWGVVACEAADPSSLGLVRWFAFAEVVELGQPFALDGLHW